MTSGKLGAVHSGVHEHIEAVGEQLLYLPAYSPDFNLIELAFAKMKGLLRSAAARIIPDLWEAIWQSPNASGSIRHTTCRDRTSSCCRLRRNPIGWRSAGCRMSRAAEHPHFVAILRDHSANHYPA
jgi:transposase